MAMPEKRCKTCRWWGDPEAIQKFVNVNRCVAPKVLFAGEGQPVNEDEPWGDQVLLGLDDNPETPQHAIAPDEASVMDGSGYFAALLTGPEFGCVNHEEDKTA